MSSPTIPSMTTTISSIHGGNYDTLNQTHSNITGNSMHAPEPIKKCRGVARQFIEPKLRGTTTLASRGNNIEWSCGTLNDSGMHLVEFRDNAIRKQLCVRQKGERSILAALYVSRKKRTL